MYIVTYITIVGPTLTLIFSSVTSLSRTVSVPEVVNYQRTTMQGADSYTKNNAMLPRGAQNCTSIALTQLPIACSTVPLVLQATGSCLEMKLAYLRPESRPRYCFKEISVIPRLTPESQEGTFSSSLSLSEMIFLTGGGATVINDRLVASWTSCSNSESESEITIATIMCSGVCQRKEGRRSEPLSSTGISAYVCRQDQVITSGTPPVRSRL